jgi:hypothetical protein
MDNKEEKKMESGNRTAEKHNNLDDFINGHLGYFGENNLSRASLDHFRETGKLSGTFRAAIHAMLLDYAKLREIGNAIIYGSPTPDASQQCEALQSENERLRADFSDQSLKVNRQSDHIEVLKSENTRLLERVKEMEGVFRESEFNVERLKNNSGHSHLVVITDRAIPDINIGSVVVVPYADGFKDPLKVVLRVDESGLPVVLNGKFAIVHRYIYD